MLTQLYMGQRRCPRYRIILHKCLNMLLHELVLLNDSDLFWYGREHIFAKEL